MLSTLFRNLHNHEIACGYLQFTENDEAIAQLSALDFATKSDVLHTLPFG
ncbi:hypothetical protein [Aulosira sp. FACHB-615]|nr:hypothetical protein [Aulosira sp. FACHB-615]MBD2492540.1 hypothetical protein [Aulosira sp. FACHB-615]